jgi:hypothetical protein
MHCERVGLVTPPEGVISLGDKEFPVCELKRYILATGNRGKIEISSVLQYLLTSSHIVNLAEIADPPSPPLVCTRAQLDVSELRKKVLSLSEDCWQV